jgi:hypothetical protein
MGLIRPIGLIHDAALVFIALSALLPGASYALAERGSIP